MPSPSQTPLTAFGVAAKPAPSPRQPHHGSHSGALPLLPRPKTGAVAASRKTNHILPGPGVACEWRGPGSDASFRSLAETTRPDWWTDAERAGEQRESLAAGTSRQTEVKLAMVTCPQKV
jgi:hypothetical protein